MSLGGALKNCMSSSPGVRDLLISTIVLIGLMALGSWLAPVDPVCMNAKWFGNDWPYRQKFLLNAWPDGNPEYSMDLQDFTIPVQISSEERAFWGNVKPDGADVRFVDCNGSLMSYEIEEFDYGAKRMLAWVKLPKLGTSAPVKCFFVYYGNSIATPTAFSDVWQSNYRYVFHMNAPKVNMLDSTNEKYRASITNYSDITNTEQGMFGRSIKLNGKSALSIEYGHDINFGKDDWSIELWARLPVSNENRKNKNILSLGADSSFNLYLHSDGFLVLELANNNVTAEISFGDAKLVPGKWTYLVIQRNGGMIDMWADDHYSAKQLKPANFAISGQHNNLLFGAGRFGYTEIALDEVRISQGIARSSSWIRATQLAASGKLGALNSVERQIIP